MGTDKELSDEEVARRRDELAKRMLSMPPKPLVRPKPEEGGSKRRRHAKREGENDPT